MFPGAHALVNELLPGDMVTASFDNINSSTGLYPSHNGVMGNDHMIEVIFAGDVVVVLSSVVKTHPYAPRMVFVMTSSGQVGYAYHDNLRLLTAK